MEAEQRVHFRAISTTFDPSFNALGVVASDTRSPAIQTGSIRFTPCSSIVLFDCIARTQGNVIEWRYTAFEPHNSNLFVISTFARCVSPRVSGTIIAKNDSK